MTHTTTDAAEARAREVLASLVEKDEQTFQGAVPLSPMGRRPSYYIRDAQGATVTAWQAIRARAHQGAAHVDQ